MAKKFERNKNKPMTLENLAESMGAEFGKVHEKFDKIDEKFGKIDEQFGKIDNRLSKGDAKFDKIDARFDRIEKVIEDLAIITAQGFERVETRLDKVEMDIDGLKTGQEEIKLSLDGRAYHFEIVDLQKRVQRLETKAGFNRK